MSRLEELEEGDTKNQWSSKCGPQTGSISTTWKLVRDAKSLALPWICWPRSSRMGPRSFKLCRLSWCTVKVGIHSPWTPGRYGRAPTSEPWSYLWLMRTMCEFIPIMQNAEVPENLRVLFVDSKEITWRTGCESHGFIRTYVHTGGGLPVKLFC